MGNSPLGEWDTTWPGRRNKLLIWDKGLEHFSRLTIKYQTLSSRKDFRWKKQDARRRGTIELSFRTNKETDLSDNGIIGLMEFSYFEENNIYNEIDNNL